MSRLDRSALVAGCVSAALFFGVASASASTLLVANTSNSLVAGNVYDTGLVTTAANATISTDYYFAVPVTVGTIDQMATFHADGSNNIGIANAMLQIFSGGTPGSPAGGSAIATLPVSNSSGVDFSSTPTLLFGLLAGNYDFRVTGTALSAGGNYDLSVIATPLPGAAVLFGSALLGMGFLGRRKRTQRAVA